jgi:prepilin-type processing-associated H-X9-DG protein
MIIEIKPWEVVKFPWGIAVRHRKGKWANIVFYDGQELNLETIGMDVILHENGIEFVKGR